MERYKHPEIALEIKSSNHILFQNNVRNNIQKFKTDISRIRKKETAERKFGSLYERCIKCMQIVCEIVNQYDEQRANTHGVNDY